MFWGDSGGCLGTEYRGAEEAEPSEVWRTGEGVHFVEARWRVSAEEDARNSWRLGQGLEAGAGAGVMQGAPLLALTLLAQQKGVEAKVVDGQVEPALPRHSALPVAAGVVVDQLLPLGHPELLPHFQLGLLELPRVFISLGLHVLVLFCNDALEEDTGNQPGAFGAPGH